MMRLATGLTALMLVLPSSHWAAGQTTALDDYVAAFDPNYGFEHETTLAGDDCTAYVLDMASQTWRSAAEVDQPVWQHWVTAVVPDNVTSDTAFLFIDGGDDRLSPPTSANDLAVSIATATHSVAIHLPTVPNQPRTFIADETHPREEDAIIAYSFDKYLDGGDANWPALLPMVKSAVNAMDAAQTFLASPAGGEVVIDNFVVAGGSKRGWTTWLTAAVDTRVRAIMPAVIDVLNLDEQMRHHVVAYQGVTDRTLGGYSAAVHDYVELGIFDRLNTPEGQALLQIVDPYEYRDRQTLNIPKYLVNSTGDEFFVPDSAQFYFDDLLGQNYLRYVPNTSHGLGQNPDVIAGIISFYSAILVGAALPEFSWSVQDGGATIQVATVDTPAAVNLWQATNPASHDFRFVTFGPQWTSSVLPAQESGIYVAQVTEPPSGATAFMVELVYDVGGIPLTFTTEVSVVPVAVPEPSTLVLVVLGLVVLHASFWRRRK